MSSVRWWCGVGEADDLLVVVVERDRESLVVDTNYAYYMELLKL